MDRNFPTNLSWSTPDSTLSKELTEIEDGICVLQDIELEIPLASIRKTFRRVYDDPELTKRLNDVYPIRGIFKNGSLKCDDTVDQKVSFDLSPARIRAILHKDYNLFQDLGDDFIKILSFYSRVQEKIIPRLTRLAEESINGSKMNIHQEMNYNYRLVDYFPVKTNSRRCGAHRDYGTFTLIFQDGSKGGLEVFNNGSWVTVSPNAGVIFLWGWSAVILSNGRIQAPLHRVVTGSDDESEIIASQRNAAIFFVAPDLEAKLTPRIRSDENLAYNPECVNNLTVRDFKIIMGKKWREREGTLTPEEKADLVTKAGQLMSQDDEIIAFLKTPTI